MSDEWIGWIRQTDEPFLADDKGNKVLDYIPCNQGAGVTVDKVRYPLLADKLPAGGNRFIKPPLPDAFAYDDLKGGGVVGTVVKNIQGTPVQTEEGLLMDVNGNGILYTNTGYTKDKDWSVVLQDVGTKQVNGYQGRIGVVVNGTHEIALLMSLNHAGGNKSTLYARDYAKYPPVHGGVGYSWNVGGKVVCILTNDATNNTLRCITARLEPEYKELSNFTTTNAMIPAGDIDISVGYDAAFKKYYFGDTASDLAFYNRQITLEEVLDSEKIVPNIPNLAGSSIPYKIVADKT